MTFTEQLSLLPPDEINTPAQVDTEAIARSAVDDPYAEHEARRAQIADLRDGEDLAAEQVGRPVEDTSGSKAVTERKPRSTGHVRDTFDSDRQPRPGERDEWVRREDGGATPIITPGRAKARAVRMELEVRNAERRAQPKIPVEPIPPPVIPRMPEADKARAEMAATKARRAAAEVEARAEVAAALPPPPPPGRGNTV